MVAPSKTVGTSVLSHQLVTHPATVKSTAFDLSTKFQTSIFLDHAIVEDAVNTDPGRWLVQVSAQASGDDQWVTFEEVPIQETAAPSNTTVTATEPQGEVDIAVAATAGFAARDVIYLWDDAGVGDSEWAIVQEVSGGNTITLVDGLTVAKDSSDVIYGSAQRDIVTIPAQSCARVRVLLMHEVAVGSKYNKPATLTPRDSVG